MSTAASNLHRLNDARLRSFVWPREHGAWGILLVPLLTGAFIGLRVGHADASALVLLTAATIALFCLRTPVEIWLEASAVRVQTQSERQTVFCSIAVYAGVAGVMLIFLLWKTRAYGLLWLGAVVGAIFLVQAVVKKLGRQTRMLAQFIGSIGLTSTAAAAYYVASGHLDSNAYLLWAANWLVVANQVHYVQVRIHSARPMTRGENLSRGWPFLIGQALTLLLLSLAWYSGYLPGLALVAFLPVLSRGLFHFVRPPPQSPLRIHRLGVSELIHALVFGILLIVGFQVSGR